MQKKRREASKGILTPESRQQTLKNHLADIAAAIDGTAESAYIKMPRHLCL